MKAKIILDTRKSRLRENGYPVVAVLSGCGRRKVVTLKIHYFEKDWNFTKEEPKKTLS